MSVALSLVDLSACERLAAERLLRRVSAVNHQPLPEDTQTLWIAGRPCGHLLPGIREQIAQSALAAWFVDTDTGVLFSPEASLNEALATVARRFHEAGYFFQWRNELLDVLPLEGETPVAQAERGLFRYLGLRSRCVYAVGITPDARFYLCRRSLTKQVDPGLWDVLAAGLMAASETPELSLRREIHEEAGLNEGDYVLLSDRRRFTVRRPVEEGWMFEEAFAVNVRVDRPEAVHNIDGEVIAIECRRVHELLARIEADEVPSDTAIAFLSALVPHTES